MAVARICLPLKVSSISTPRPSPGWVQLVIERTFIVKAKGIWPEARARHFERVNWMHLRPITLIRHNNEASMVETRTRLRLLSALYILATLNFLLNYFVYHPSSANNVANLRTNTWKKNNCYISLLYCVFWDSASSSSVFTTLELFRIFQPRSIARDCTLWWYTPGAER